MPKNCQVPVPHSSAFSIRTCKLFPESESDWKWRNVTAGYFIAVGVVSYGQFFLYFLFLPRPRPPGFRRRRASFRDHRPAFLHVVNTGENPPTAAASCPSVLVAVVVVSETRALGPNKNKNIEASRVNHLSVFFFFFLV